MFGLIKKLREKDEQIGELQHTLQREAGTIDAYHRAEKAALDAKFEVHNWKEKYSLLFEKHLNLLDRYSKLLEGKADAGKEIAERWLNDE